MTLFLIIWSSITFKTVDCHSKIESIFNLKGHWLIYFGTVPFKRIWRSTSSLLDLPVWYMIDHFRSRPSTLDLTHGWVTHTIRLIQYFDSSSSFLNDRVRLGRGQWCRRPRTSRKRSRTGTRTSVDVNFREFFGRKRPGRGSGTQPIHGTGSIITVW